MTPAQLHALKYSLHLSLQQTMPYILSLKNHLGPKCRYKCKTECTNVRWDVQMYERVPVIVSYQLRTILRAYQAWTHTGRWHALSIIVTVLETLYLILIIKIKT